MRVTQTQKQRMLEVIDEIRDRQLVYLEGKSNGKTRILNELQEVALLKDPNTGKLVIKRNHVESNDVEFLTRLHWPTRDMTALKIQRQIVAKCGRGYKRDTHACDLAFHGILREYHEQGKVICVIVDNAELLSASAFNVMKELNEVRDHKRRIDLGVSFVFAGQFTRMKAPMSFIDHCASVRVDRITQVEISEILQSAFPVYANAFDDKAIRRLSILETTGKIHKAARNAVQIMRRDRAKVISLTMLEEALAA